MAYTALYRKWRPQTFEDVRGQEHIVTALRNQINSGRIGHAYLFCGTRGTGKTSIAKILARAVNCEHPVNGSPCNRCASCQAILNGSSMNVVEIDAASNNGVDNIREIRDEVRYSPTDAKYRVYIIDEVHMLSAGAFNALLKTLEEPPSYVIFILATTEVHRIPITVLSRCQRYDFRRISTDTLYDQLKKLTDAEGIAIEEKALRYIARLGDGSMRDSQSLLEQCVAFSFGETMTYEKVLDVLGAVDTSVFSRLLQSVRHYDVSGGIHLLDEISAQGRDLTQFVTDFIWYLRSLLLVQTGADAEEALDMSAENLAVLKKEAQEVETDTLLRYIRVFSELSGQMRSASSKRVLLDVALIRMMKPAMEQDQESMKQRISQLENQVAALAAGGVIPAAASAGATAQTGGNAVSGQTTGGDSGGQDAAAAQEAPKIKKVAVTPAVYADFSLLKENWHRIINSQSPLVASLLRVCELTYEQERGYVILCSEGWEYMMLQNQEYLDKLSATTEQEIQKAVTYSVRLRDKNEATTELISDGRIAGINMDIGIEEE